MAIPHPYSRSRGFTLIELVVALVILGILTALSVPAFREFTANRKLAAASFGLVTDLMFARSEALKRRAEVTVSPVAEADWTSGWIVSIPGQNLRESGRVGSGVLKTDAAPGAIVFSDSGRVENAGIVRVGFKVDLEGVPQRCVSIDPSGRPRAVQEECP